MNGYLIEPRDTLVFRDARPFGLGTSRLRSLPFPHPSSVAGCLRTAVFRGDADEVRRLAVLGPLLYDLAGAQLLAPAPLDCAWADGEAPRRVRLVPSPLPDWSDHPLPFAVAPSTELPQGKAPAGRPAWWSWSEFDAWLRGEPTETPMQDIGLPLLARDRRMHVGVAADTGTAEDGKLYSTEGLCFRTDDGRDLALAVWSDVLVADRRVTLGGERRLSYLTAARLEVPPCPPEFGEVVRVLLLTPGIFREGWRPTFDDAEVIAAAVGRPEVVSGWDYEKRGPKALRRAAPAGSVYWVRPRGDATAWARARWFASVCEGSQDRLDGFGLAAVGVV